MTLPSPELVEKLKDLINSRGFINALMLLIIGWVIYSAINPIVAVPAKLDIIIVKLNQCVERRIASGGQ